MTNKPVAIVTGGSRGIGRAIVTMLAQRGHRVLFSYLRGQQAAAQVEYAVRNAGGEAKAMCADAADGDSARSLVHAALAQSGRIDVLVNNAGVHLPGVLLADTSAKDWEHVLRVNLSGPFHMIQAVLPHMRQRGAGNIVNLSSNVTNRFPAGAGVYTVSKIALEAMTKILSKEEGKYGIRVNAVGPGPIATDMLHESLAKIGEEKADAFIRSVPLGRKGTPEEIAEAVAFLVSDAASYMTGQILFVNGGGPGG